MGFIGSIATGVAAGAAGTLAMDALWYVRYRRGGGTQGVVAWETAAGTEGYAQASAPARTAQLAARRLAHVELGDATARAATNVMHWATGSGWGGVYGAGRAVLPTRWQLSWALGFGPLVFASSYAMLGAVGIYQPIWTYSRSVLWQDFSAHLAYGLTTAATYEGLS